MAQGPPERPWPDVLCPRRRGAWPAAPTVTTPGRIRHSWRGGASPGVTPLARKGPRPSTGHGSAGPQRSLRHEIPIPVGGSAACAPDVGSTRIHDRCRPKGPVPAAEWITSSGRVAGDRTPGTGGLPIIPPAGRRAPVRHRVPARREQHVHPVIGHRPGRDRPRRSGDVTPGGRASDQWDSRETSVAARSDQEVEVRARVRLLHVIDVEPLPSPGGLGEGVHQRDRRNPARPGQRGHLDVEASGGHVEDTVAGDDPAERASRGGLGCDVQDDGSVRGPATSGRHRCGSCPGPRAGGVSSGSGMLATSGMPG